MKIKLHTALFLLVLVLVLVGVAVAQTNITVTTVAPPPAFTVHQITIPAGANPVIATILAKLDAQAGTVPAGQTATDIHLAKSGDGVTWTATITYQ